MGNVAIHGFGRIGRSTMRVVGAVTRRNYWFAQEGARVVVDRRDAPSLAGVPQLVQRPSAG